MVTSLISTEATTENRQWTKPVAGRPTETAPLVSSWPGSAPRGVSAPR
jgi:hypothetical protein